MPGNGEPAAIKSVLLAVSVSVDNPMVIAHRVGQDIGAINAIYRAVNVEVVVFSMMVHAQIA